MPITFIGHKASDGKLFEDALPATVHEVRAAITKSFPQLKGSLPADDEGMLELSVALMPIAALAQIPPLSSENTTLEAATTVCQDRGAPQENLPENWRYVETSEGADESILDSYQHKNGGLVYVKRLDAEWPLTMLEANDEGEKRVIKRFGKTAPLGCAHRWVSQDSTNGSFDLCLECEKTRA